MAFGIFDAKTCKLKTSYVNNIILGREAVYTSGGSSLRERPARTLRKPLSVSVNRAAFPGCKALWLNTK